MTSQQLADLLRAQASANQGIVTLNDATLGTSNLDASIERDLLRSDGTLYLVVDVNAIPVTPPSSGFSLPATVPAGNQAFLHLDQRTGTLGFAFAPSLTLTLTVQARQTTSGAAPWEFSTSFPELAYQPYDILDLSDPQLVFSNAPTGGSLAFAGSLTPKNLFGTVATLMHLSSSYGLAGTFVRDGDGGFSFVLSADLGVPSFSLGGVISLEGSQLGVAYAEKKDKKDGSEIVSVQLYLGATVQFGSKDGTPVAVDVRLAMPISNPSSPLLQLSVLPKDFSTTLTNLGSAIGGQTWDDFFNAPPGSELKPFFDVFGFIGYTMAISTSGKVTALSLSVGTLKPWKIFGDYEITLKGTWSVLFLGDGAAQSLALHAGFDYDGKMGFDVDVTLPGLHISGRQTGDPISLSLKDAVDKLFGAGAIAVPEDLLKIAVGNFTIDIDRPAQTLAIGMSVDASVALFGVQLLALHDMAISVLVDKSNPAKTIYTGNIDGQISLGPITAQVDAVLSNDPNVGCTFTMHLVNETVGSMLGHLVHLVDPTFSVSFGEPWDKLLDISLDALVLKVDITNKKVEIDYVKTIDLGFLTITQLGLAWQKNENGPSTTKITIAGSLLGIDFGKGSGNPPLAWDPINENPPAVPGAGDKLLDLRYVGIGQHVGFDPSWQPANVEAVITKMEQLALPAGGSNIPNLTSPGGLQFRKDSSWLVGADFTILGTVQLAFVFNDPALYGLLIALSGERAKSFAGLKFEILYHKVTDTIGVYHLELKLPDAMRHLEFGEVSLTLPQIVLDIYTNGNFRIDFGFPVGLDFSNSFCLQVFPFIGYGGFYFALLNGDTSTRVPKITNGTFDPVIEFGLALSVGVGKTIDEGILSGGLSVVVIGIVEGVIGWFNPNDSAVEKAEYYWLQGTISIVGRLYGTINFYIIQASLSVTAYASVTLLIEAHQPILISMSVGVSVEVSIKIVFFTIHCSFSATVSASFTIGSASPTPWVLAGSGGGNTGRLQLFAHRDGLHAPQHRMFSDMPRFARRELMQRRLEAGDLTLNWAQQTVFESPRQVPLHAMPAFTQADGGVAGILLLGIADGIPARAGTLQEHVMAAATAADPGMADVLEGLVRWAILNARATLGETDLTVVSHDDVALLARAFADDDTLSAAVDYNNFLSAFLGLNYRFAINPPALNNDGGDTGVAVFPMPPALTMTAGANPALDFAAFNGLDAKALAKMQAYFQLAAVDYEKFVAQTGGDAAAQVEGDAGTTPAAQVIFEQYFAMLMRSAVKAAGDVLQRYSFTYGDASQAYGIAEVRTTLGDPGLPTMNVVSPNRGSSTILAQSSVVTFTGTQHQTVLGESFASIAAAFNKVLPAGAQITKEQVAQANAGNGALYVPGTSVTFTNLQWTTLAGESVNLIVARLLTRAASPGFVQQLPGLQTLAQAIYTANPQVFPPPADPIASLRTPIDPATFPQLTVPQGTTTITYSTAPGDTFTSIAASFITLSGGFVDIPTAAAWILANNNLSVTDPSLPQPTGTQMKLPAIGYALQAGANAEDIAVQLLTNVPTVISSLLAVPAQTNLLASQAMVALPPLQYAVRQNDTLASIAALFNLTLDGLAASLEASQTAIFAAGSQIAVADVEQMSVAQLIAALAATQWATVAPMASRFMLSGLRLPDPNDPAFKNLTLEEMSDPRKLGAIETLPLYAQTGQQFAIAAQPGPGYTIQLAPDGGTVWIANTTPVSFQLTTEQLDVITAIAGAGFAPPTELEALPLFRLAPARSTLQKHLSWQPAKLPGDAVYSPTAAGSVTGNPDIWIFPDALLSELTANGANQPPYAVSIGTHETAQSGMTITNAQAFAWATTVRIAIQQLPADESGTATASSIVMMTGVDDDGLSLLSSLLAQLQNDSATLFLLYQPNPASTAAGLFSDDLGPATALVQTNLSTLSHSGGQARSAALIDEATGAPTYIAPLSNASAFLQMLWECSIVRSGGYYLRYAPSGGGPLPPALFTNGPTAELTLLVVLTSQNLPHAPMLPFNNCAIVGDNIDPGSSNVFVQSATWLVAQPSSLTDAATYAAATFGLTLTPAAIATLNADVPQLLRPGAVVSVPGGAGTDTVRIDDTFNTLAARNGLVPATLATFAANSAATLFTPTGLVQFADGALKKTAAIAAGNAGFQLTRPKPDPGNQQQITTMDGATIVAELYHMLAHRIVPNVVNPAAFLKSGEAVPVGPAQSVPTENGGNPPPDAANDRWDYHQAVAIAPFALTSYGSASPALPDAAQNPYAGVAPDGSVTLAFEFADPFGNELAMPSNAQTLVQPVRYFDDLVGIARWPSAAASYTLGGDGNVDPTLGIALTMHMDKYAVSPTLTAERAAKNAATDRATYLRAYYQLVQPDVGFALSTTLEAPVGGHPVSHALDQDIFRAFVMSALVTLDAFCATSPAVFVANGGETIGSVASKYDVGLADVFAANGASLYSQMFGMSPLVIPKLYTTIAGDTLSGIASHHGIDDPLRLVQQNPWALLDPTNDLAAPARSVTPSATDTLASIAGANQSSVSGLADSNSGAALTDNLPIAVAGMVVTTNQDTFATLVKKFDALNLPVTAGEIAIANQTIPGIFATPVTLTVEDVVPTALDSLGSLQRRFGFEIATLASANEMLPNLFASGTSLYIRPGPVGNVPPAGTTLAQFAANAKVPLAALGLALWDGVDRATPGNVNADIQLVASAAVTVPATIINSGAGQHATYRALITDVDIATIAAKFAGNDPAALGPLNIDLPGLFQSGTPVIDAASGTSIPTTSGTTFASLVAAFAKQGHTVTAESLARDNATTAKLVQPGAMWIVPPMVAVAQKGGGADTLALIAARYGMDVATVAQNNAGVIGFLAPNVNLPAYNGIPTYTTGPNTTFNALIGIYTLPGAVAPTLGDLAKAFADVALVAPDALVLPVPVPGATATQIQANFTEPMFALGVSITENRTPAWVADDFITVPGVATTTFDIPAQPEANGSNLLSLDAFATAVETALPGVRLATGDPANETDDPAQPTLWIVNFSNSRGPAVTYTAQPATAVRSFAIPPLSTALASGTVPVTPYVSGKGLTGTPLPIVFAGTDLDVWGATFLSAMDLVLAPIYAVPAQETSLKDFDTIVNAKRTLATAISGRVQYILDGGGPGEYGSPDPRRESAIAAMEQALLVALSSAYSIESVVQTAFNVASPYTDSVTAPRLSGKAALTETGGAAPIKNASLSTAKVPLAATQLGSDQMLASFLLTAQAPATDRNISATVTYEVAEIERPSGPPDPNGYQASSWLTLVHPRSDSSGVIADVTIPIPLRAYPSPLSLLSQTATAAYPAPTTTDQLVRWSADATWIHQDADQDQIALRMEVGTANPGALGRMIGAEDTDALFAALAQFITVWPAINVDLALFTARGPNAPADATTAQALAAFATLAGAVATAWPTNAIVPPPLSRAALIAEAEIVPGTYNYVLTRPPDPGPDLTTLTVFADAANPVTLWPEFAVYTGSGKIQPLTLESSTSAQASYAYPLGIPKGKSLQYQVTVPKLDVVIIPDFELSASVTRNADLVSGVTTCPLFVYSTPYTGFPSALIPLLLVDEDFDIGSGPVLALEAALQTFFQTLLDRGAAPPDSTRTLRVAASYGYELSFAAPSRPRLSVRGAKSAINAADTGLVPRLPIALIPAVELTINGDKNASINAFATNLAGFIVDWDKQVQPSLANASLFFEVSLFSANAGSNDKPLLIVRSVRYVNGVER